MIRGPVLLLLTAMSPVAALTSQEQHHVDSNGSLITITGWVPDGSANATVLLVPGWGGGPTDVLGIGRFLAANDVEAYVVTPRGWHSSEGQATFANALEDIGEALAWVRERTSHPVVLGGHSFGGGMAMAYAAQDSSVKRLISVAGTDHGQLIRQYQSDSRFAAILEPILESTAAPEGPIRFDVESSLQELIDGEAVFGLRENASALASRSILLFGGWDDVNTTVDDYMLPLYRALKAAGGTDVRFVVYHTDHGFGNVRSEMYAEILDWVAR